MTRARFFMTMNSWDFHFFLYLLWRRGVKASTVFLALALALALSLSLALKCFGREEENGEEQFVTTQAGF